MLFLFTIVSKTILLVIFTVAEASYVTPCRDSDQACIDNMVNDAYQQFMVGIPELRIEPHEPMHHALIEGDLAGLKYTFYNATISGMNKCKASNVNFNQETLKVLVHLSCPKIVIESDYETSGALIMVPVHGKGDIHIVTGLYNLDFDCNVKIVEGSEGKRHISVKSCKVTADAVEPIDFDIRNLFDGNKALSDVFHDFIHANWKEVHDFVKDPVWNVHTKKLMSTANTFLTRVSLDDMKSSK